MILLWFLLGLALILGIARYNEGNKLFWVLLFSYIMGFAAAKMVIDLFGHHDDERSNVNLTQVCPTQTPSITPNAIELFTCVTDLVSTKVTALKSVSQVYTPVAHEIDVTVSQVFGRTRDQPILTLTKPPEL
jgi:hypothetical protein